MMETGKRFRVSMDNYEMIIQEATRQFQIKGLKFTMDDIAKEMHIAKKTIYQSFSSKEELMRAMLDAGFRVIHERKKEILHSDMPLAEKLAAVMIAMPDQYDLLDFRKLSGLSQSYPEVNAHLKAHLENDWEPVIALMEEGIRTGELREVSVPIVRLMFTASVEAFLSSDTLTQEKISYSEALEELIGIIMKGIMK